MTADSLWTIDELSAAVADALAVDYAGPPSGRVREVPDRRTIRWYTTIGLLDRPAAMRGRTALYGRRHLLQLVAIKRLQAAGRSLADVQQVLLGATNRTLTRIARIPQGQPSVADQRLAVDRAVVDQAVAAGPVAAGRRLAGYGLSTSAGSSGPVGASAVGESVATPDPTLPGGPNSSRPGRFDERLFPGEPVVPAGGAVPGERSGLPGEYFPGDAGVPSGTRPGGPFPGEPGVPSRELSGNPAPTRRRAATPLSPGPELPVPGRTGQPLPTQPTLPPAQQPPDRVDTHSHGRFWAALAPPAPDPPLPAVIHGVQLRDSVTLVLPPGARTPDTDDLAAIRDAAGPLLAVLRQRGLDGMEGNPDDNAR